MKILIEVTFSEAQKAILISRNEQIPSGAIALEVSDYLVGVLRHFKGNYTISNQSIYVQENVKYPSLKGYHHITTRISDLIAKGTLKEGGCINKIMQEFADLIKADQADIVRKNEKEKADRNLWEYMQPLKKWKEYNTRKIKSQEVAIKDAKEDAERDRLETKKLTWIEQNGSERLKKGIKHGYTCQKKYVMEKSESILGIDYISDYDGDIKTKERCCPTLESLNEVEFQSQKHPEIKNVKVVYLPDGLLDTPDDDWEGCEAVEVQLKDLTGYWYRTF